MTEEIDSDEPKPSTERWVYAGLRENTAGQLVEAWATEEGLGKELIFKGKGLRARCCRPCSRRHLRRSPCDLDLTQGNLAPVPLNAARLFDQ